MANSKVDSVEAKSSRLRKDLIEAMDQSTKAKEKVIELKEALKVEKKLVINNDIMRSSKGSSRVVPNTLANLGLPSKACGRRVKGHHLERRYGAKK